MKSRNRFVIIGNPVAGGGAQKKIYLAESLLKAKGCDVTVRLTSKRGDAEVFAKEAAMLADTTIIAAGGDGTYNEVANGLMHSSTPMAILPIGTTSVLAREFSIPLTTNNAIDVAIKGKIETVNVGKVTYPSTSESSSPEVRHFLLMAGVGYDGDSVYNVDIRVKKLSGRLAYILSGLYTIIKYRPEELAIKAAISDNSDFENGRFRIHPDYCSVSEGRLSAKSYIAVISKAAAYGGDFSLTPDACLLSPWLHVFLHHKKSKLSLIRMLIAIVTGRAMDLRNISYFRTENISIVGSSRMQIDGDYAGNSPVSIEIVRNALKLIIPA